MSPGFRKIDSVFFMNIVTIMYFKIHTFNCMHFVVDCFCSNVYNLALLNWINDPE